MVLSTALSAIPKKRDGHVVHVNKYLLDELDGYN